jgi:hypothetical protein
VSDTLTKVVARLNSLNSLNSLSSAPTTEDLGRIEVGAKRDWTSAFSQLITVNVKGHDRASDKEAIEALVQYNHPGAAVSMTTAREGYEGVYDVLVSVSPEERALWNMSKAQIKKRLDAEGTGLKYFNQHTKAEIIHRLLSGGYEYFLSTLVGPRTTITDEQTQALAAGLAKMNGAE